MQKHLFPGLLSSLGYYAIAEPTNTAATAGRAPAAADVGSAAVASGQAHLLPSLEQRCPGLLDPELTLEAAARHCDLAGLQAAWGLLAPRLPETMPAKRLRFAYRHALSAAAGTATHDSIAKMEWVVGQARAQGVKAISAGAVSAAAVSGDLARLQWLRERGCFRRTAPRALLVQDAGVALLQQLAGEGGYLPPAGDGWWAQEGVVGAASAASDSAAKLRWLADRGVPLGMAQEAVAAAARCGNLEAVQLLLQQHGVERVPQLLDEALAGAAGCGHIPTAMWALQAGGRLECVTYPEVVDRGDLPALRWLLEAGCPRGTVTVSTVVTMWPSGTPGDTGRLVEAVRLLAAAGWPITEVGAPHPLVMAAGAGQPWPVWQVVSCHESHPLVVAAHAGHPWPVWQALRELMPEDERAVPRAAALAAAAAGCEATLEALVGLGVCEEHGAELACAWYAAAARNGDLGTLSCLVRLGVPLGEGVLAAAVGQGAPLSALQWLAGQGAPVVEAEVREVLLRGSGAVYLAERAQERQGVDTWLRGLLEPRHTGGGEVAGLQQLRLV